jgi:hypothetical protein
MWIRLKFGLESTRGNQSRPVAAAELHGSFLKCIFAGTALFTISCFLCYCVG